VGNATPRRPPLLIQWATFVSLSFAGPLALRVLLESFVRNPRTSPLVTPGDLHFALLAATGSLAALVLRQAYLHLNGRSRG
jgi:hypothetical protein